VTPDALGDWWRDGKLHRKLMVDLNGKPFGRAEAGEDMTFDFGTLIAMPQRRARWAQGRSSARAPSRIAAPMAGRASRSPMVAWAIRASRRCARSRHPGWGGGDAVPEKGRYGADLG